MRSYGLGRARRIVGLPVAFTMAVRGTAAASPESGGDSEWNLTAGTEYGRDGSRASLMSADYAGKHDSGTAESASRPGHAAFGLSGLHADTAASSASDSSTASGATALSGAIPVLKAVAIKLAVGTTVTNSVSAPYRSVYVLVNL